MTWHTRCWSLLSPCVYTYFEHPRNTANFRVMNVYKTSAIYFSTQLLNVYSIRLEFNFRLFVQKQKFCSSNDNLIKYYHLLSLIFSAFFFIYGYTHSLNIHTDACAKWKQIVYNHRHETPMRIIVGGKLLYVLSNCIFCCCCCFFRCNRFSRLKFIFIMSLIVANDTPI